MKKIIHSHTKKNNKTKSALFFEQLSIFVVVVVL